MQQNLRLDNQLSDQMDSFPITSDFLSYEDKENTNENLQVKQELDFLQMDANFLCSDLTNITSLCKLENDDETQYVIKYKIQGGKHVKKWQCKTCFKEFGHHYTVLRHIPTHTGERKFTCNTCGKAFRQMSTLAQHRAIHSQERPYVCEICNKTFNRISTLISHRKTHTGLKPHCCHLCNKAFHQKGNLRNHIFTHTNERPYKCDHCGKGFNQMSNLMCHKLKSHQCSDRPQYSCRFCKKTFTKRSTLRHHENYDHSIGGDEPVVTEDNKSQAAIFVEPIKTHAMQLAIETHQTPFALLRPLTGIPVLVRVLPAGEDKQMLVPATAEDLKFYGEILVTPKSAEEVSNGASNLMGSTVQIKIPVVATVIQQSGLGGHMSMAVVSPGPGDKVAQPDGGTVSTYVFDGNEAGTLNPTLEESFFTETITDAAHTVDEIF